MMTRVEMFREKLDRLNISDYHGLNSPGVTCYLNSVLQVLFMTEDFREAVKGGSREDSTAIDEHLRSLFSDLEKSAARTHGIAKKLGITNVYEQRDAAEYFEKILCRTSPEAAKMFKGELNHRTTCHKCMCRSDSRGFFWMLPLPVEDSSRQSYSVEEGLKDFFKGDKVCGDNKIYCNRCAQKQDADFGCEMTQDPEVLTLLLKRFTFDYKRGRYVKLHCKVDVPQVLHRRDCDYDLYALVSHFGNLTGGHYTAQIKSFETQEWYDFNDSVVKGVKPLFGVGDKSLRSSTAYLLMYRKGRRNPPKIPEGDQAALGAYSDVESEQIYEEAERGAALVPRHQLKDEICNGGESVKRLIGDELRPRQTAGDGCKTRWQTQRPNSAKLQKHERQKKTSVTDRSLTRNGVTRAEAAAEVGTGGKSGQRREANVYDVKSLHISCNGRSYSPRPYLTGHSQSRSHPNEPSESEHSANRTSSRPKRDAEKMRHALTADSSCRPDPIQRVTKGEKSPRKKNAAKSRDEVRREPWRS